MLCCFLAVTSALRTGLGEFFVVLYMFFPVCVSVGSAADSLSVGLTDRLTQVALCCPKNKNTTVCARSRLVLVWQCVSEGELYGGDEITAMQASEGGDLAGGQNERGKCMINRLTRCGATRVVAAIQRDYSSLRFDRNGGRTGGGGVLPHGSTCLGSTAIVVYLLLIQPSETDTRIMFYNQYVVIWRA